MDIEKPKAFDSLKIDTGQNEANSKAISMASIMRHLVDLDTNPPYQRGKVWKDHGKHQLIRSIMNDMPINTIHFVYKNEDHNGTRWVLDGKQRIETIRSFLNNEFKVKVKYKGKIYEVGWRELSDETHPCYDLSRRFRDAQVNVVTWGYRSITEQRDIFMILNYSSTLIPDEKLYCEHFLVQKALKQLFNDCIRDSLSKYFNKKCVDDYRFNGSKFLHTLLLYCYGKDLMDVFAARNSGQKDMQDSCKRIEQMIISHNIDASMPSNEIYKIEIFKKISSDLKMVARWFDNSVSYANSIPHKFDQIFILDILSFFIKKYHEQVLTKSYVDSNLKEINTLIVKWNNFKNEHRDKLKRRSTQASNVKDRIENLEIIFNECCSDISIKNKPITREEKISAGLASEGYCPITGERLTDTNTQFDHVDPKSTSSKTKVVAISQNANRKKTNLTFDNVKNLNSYMEKYSLKG